MENQGEMFSDLALEKQYDNMVKELDMENEETIEESAREYYKRGQLGYEKAADTERAFLRGGLWQQERSYSKEQVLNILHNYRNHFELYRNIEVLPNDFFEWFQQFKKK